MATNETLPPADEVPVERGVGRLPSEGTRACAQGCNGCDDCTDYEDPENDPPAREASDWSPPTGYDGNGSVAAMAARAERTVASIPDDELLRRVVQNLTRKRPRRKEFAWSEVMAAFGLGSTYAMQLCRRFGIDPDTGADLKTPNV